MYSGDPSCQGMIRGVGNVDTLTSRNQDNLGLNGCTSTASGHAPPALQRRITLFGGITRHDMINKVSAIMGYISLAKNASRDPMVTDYLTKIESAASTIQPQIEFARIYQELGSYEPR